MPLELFSARLHIFHAHVPLCRPRRFQFVSSLWGFDVDWDVGPTPEERMRMNEGRMTSRELRESLSTFEDPTAELRGEDRDYYDDEVDEDMEDEADDSFDEEGSQGDTDDTPPDLRRSS